MKMRSTLAVLFSMRDIRPRRRFLGGGCVASRVFDWGRRPDQRVWGRVLDLNRQNTAYPQG